MAFPARLVELFKTGAALCGPGVSSAGLGGFLGWQPVFFWEHTPKKAGCVGAKAIFFGNNLIFPVLRASVLCDILRAIFSKTQAVMSSCNARSVDYRRFHGFPL